MKELVTYLLLFEKDDNRNIYKPNYNNILNKNINGDDNNIFLPKNEGENFLKGYYEIFGPIYNKQNRNNIKKYKANPLNYKPTANSNSIVDINSLIDDIKYNFFTTPNNPGVDSEELQYELIPVIRYIDVKFLLPDVEEESLQSEFMEVLQGEFKSQYISVLSENFENGLHTTYIDKPIFYIGKDIFKTILSDEDFKKLQIKNSGIHNGTSDISSGEVFDDIGNFNYNVKKLLRKYFLKIIIRHDTQSL